MCVLLDILLCRGVHLFDVLLARQRVAHIFGGVGDAHNQVERHGAARLGREQNFVGRVETGQRRVDLIEFIWICRACEAEPVGEIKKIVDSVGAPVRSRSRR